MDNNLIEAVETVKGELQSIEQRIDANESDKTALRSNIETEKKPHCDAMKVIDQKYAEAIRQNQAQRDELEKVRNIIIQQLRMTEATLGAIPFLKENKITHEVLQYWRMKTKGNLMSRDCYLVEDATTKEMQKKGITITRIGKGWMMDEKEKADQHEEYYGFLAHIITKAGQMKVIGFSGRRHGEHPGDETSPYSFICLNSDTMNLSKHLTVEKTSRYSGMLGQGPATYRDWMKELSKLTNEQLADAEGMDYLKAENQSIFIEFDGM